MQRSRGSLSNTVNSSSPSKELKRDIEAFGGIGLDSRLKGKYTKCFSLAHNELGISDVQYFSVHVVVTLDASFLQSILES